MLKMVSQLVPKLINMFNDIPDSSDYASGTCLIKGYTRLITTFLQAKNSQQIVDAHATATVFDCTKPLCTANIKWDWWFNTDEKPQFLARSLVTFGPANSLSPPYFQRPNQGILCQPHAVNNNMTPIEYLVHTVNMEFCRTREHMAADEVMEGFVEIFTSTDPVGNPDIDNHSFVFVKGADLLPIKAKRLDLVHAIRVVFYTGMLVYLANPKDFQHYHPLVLITNIFLAQNNFFPTNKDMDKPLTKAQKTNYLLALGLNIFEAIRKDFDASFFLDNADFFPPTFNPTTMPAPQRAIGYVPSGSPPSAPPASEAVFHTFYFLFGERVLQNQTEPDTTIKAEPLDDSILPYYEYAVNNEFDQFNRDQLKTLITIVCPKHTLNLKDKTYFGLKKKTNMTAFLTQHLPAFNAIYFGYITDLKEATLEPDAAS